MRKCSCSLPLVLWLIVGVGVLSALIRWGGIRIATSEQRDENGKRTSLNLMVIVGMGNNINLNDSRINHHEEPHT